MKELPRPTTPRGEATRRKLLEAAEAEIGERGYARTSVAGITRRAGVGQGTFYLYFPSKDDALRELVRDMGKRLRRSLSQATAGAKDRVEVEKRGFKAFLRFASENQNLYRVVMESQFVDESIYREYYHTLADGYSANLARAQAGGEIRAGDAEAQAWALMGVAHFLGLRYAIWEQSKPTKKVIDTTFDLLFDGLAVKP